ncbi:hypothetical protein Poli38472_000593 [Pythium oligandrum]|uniref:homoserine dehydrogenase n=1 Tax=Pythium oligandrum TaxID=41045 RepID=A0A8K1CCS5_PYTOL|nr:hypothetical protein Poli38472_000593 [Pythium oligandrum]|eukprot:TMW60551.1 hypothetical protein Poli38472_000593 [Pythium oligandrum]
MKRIGVIAAGAGAVGAQFLRVLEERFCTKELTVCVVAIGDSRGFVCNVDKGLAWSDVHAVLQHKSDGQTIPSWKPSDLNEIDTLDTLVAVVDYITSRPRGFDDYIVIDCTSSNQIASALVHASTNDFAVVMANKLPLSGSMEQYRQLAWSSDGTVRSQRVRYEATVGAGLPVVDTVKHVVASRDTIQTIQGSLSGTMAFIFSKMTSGSSFSEALLGSHRAGITEADPRDDLSGVDVARKMIIVAREMGFSVEIDSHVDIEPLLPPAMFELPIESFFDKLSKFDGGFAQRMQAAKAADSTLAYLGSISPDGRVRVGLEVVPLTSVFAQTTTTENAVVLHTEWFPEPLVLRGTGAGIHSTAAALASDVGAIVAGHND